MPIVKVYFQYSAGLNFIFGDCTNLQEGFDSLHHCLKSPLWNSNYFSILFWLDFTYITSAIKYSSHQRDWINLLDIYIPFTYRRVILLHCLQYLLTSSWMWYQPFGCLLLLHLLCAWWCQLFNHLYIGRCPTSLLQRKNTFLLVIISGMSGCTFPHFHCKMPFSPCTLAAFVKCSWSLLLRPIIDRCSCNDDQT